VNRRTIGIRALASTGVVGLVMVLQFGVSFVSQIVLARLLPPEIFGQFAFVLLVQGLVSACRTIQAGEFLVCRKNDIQVAYNTVFTADLVLSGLTVLGALVFAHPIMSVAGQPALAGALSLSILACLTAPFGTPGALFQRDIDFLTTGKARAGGILIGPILKIVLAYMGFGLYSLIIGELFRQALEVAIVWFSASERPQLQMDWPTLKEALRFSLPISLSSLLVYYYWKADDFIVGRTLGMEQLGYYWLAFRIPEYMLILRGHFLPIVFSAFARLEAVEDQRRIFELLTRLTTLVLFPVALLGLVHPDALIIPIYGPRWAPAIPPFQLLMLTGALRMATSYSGDLFKISGRTWVFPLTGGLNAVLLTAGVYALTVRMGITGTGLAVLLMVLLSMPLTEILLWRWFKLSPCRLLLKPVLILTLCTLAGTQLRKVFPPTLLGAAIDSLCLVGFYLALTYVLDRPLIADLRWLRDSHRSGAADSTVSPS
jgi:O-antigen/teichoic acid export membrane protein